MKDELISFETAKLAKEKGFKLGVMGKGYSKSGKIGLFRGCPPYEAPTQSLLQRWFREEHNIDVLVDTDMVQREEMYVVNVAHKTRAIFPNVDLPPYHNYEEALEFGLLRTLELLS